MLAVLALATALSLSLGANAARSCANGTYAIRVGDLRYDSADNTTQFATIAAALSYTGGAPLYECNAQWPEAWAGWFEGGSNIIWGDCIWTGAGVGSDTAVGFAVDWKTKTMYLSHTFACSDQPGVNALATGSLELDLNCTTIQGSGHCVPNTGSDGARPLLTIGTKIAPASTAENASCVENSAKYHSWQLEQWLRRYEMGPASLAPGFGNAPLSDSGPSFTLKSMTTSDVFTCMTSGQKDGAFQGACQSNSTTTTAKFLFDPKLNFLTLTQNWNCGNSSSFDAVGVGYVQATCDRDGSLYTCTSLPVWIGTKTV